MKCIKLLVILLLVITLPACDSIKSVIQSTFESKQQATDNKTALSWQNNYSDSILIKGLYRSFMVHLPISYDKNLKWPLVIALHGGGGSGGGMGALTDFNSLADRQGFIVAYPEGYEKNWNDGRNEKSIKAQAANIDDVYFISSLIEYLVKDLGVDSKRVYVTGISNGAIMSHRLGCELSDRIAAIAPVAGNIPQKMANIWSPSRPVSILIINGTEDALVPYGGGDVSFLSLKRGKVLSVADTVKFWVNSNGCQGNPDTFTLPHLNPQESTSTVVYKYPGCRNGSEVILYEVNGGGHTWPGGLQYMPENMIGKTSRDFNATEIIWEFFKKHPMN